jgi:serine/threonine-protein kinase RsbW
MKRHRLVEAEYPADPRIVHEVRNRLQEFLRPCKLEGEEIEAIKVAVSEACSNAVCHGSPAGAECRVRVRYELDGDELAIEVTDEGRGFEPEQIALPELEEWKPSGRGLFLILAFMDDVQFEALPNGTRVRLVKRLGGQEPEKAESTDSGFIHTLSRASGSAGFFPRPQPAYHERA